MKLNKKQKKYLGYSLVGILILGIILFSNLNTLSFLVDNNRLYNIQQVSSNSNSYTYQLQIKTSDPLSENLACGADVVNSIKVDDTIQWTNDRRNFDNTDSINVNLPDDIQYNQPFQASSVGFSGLSFVISPSGCPSTQAIYADNGTYCIALNKNDIRCTFNGKLTTGGQFRNRPVGDWTASVQVTLLKEGYCSDNNMCQSGFECVSGVCTQVSSNQVNVYRLQNDACLFMTILSSERTSNDYNTLEECQTNIGGNNGNGDINKINYLSIILILIGFIVLIIFLIWLLKKTRKNDK